MQLQATLTPTLPVAWEAYCIGTCHRHSVASSTQSGWWLLEWKIGDDPSPVDLGIVFGTFPLLGQMLRSFSRWRAT